MLYFYIWFALLLVYTRGIKLQRQLDAATVTKKGISVSKKNFNFGLIYVYECGLAILATELTTVGVEEDLRVENCLSDHSVELPQARWNNVLHKMAGKSWNRVVQN